ncbi:MAG TPA: hypothetical protein PKO15_11875 [Fibrobacteria bacterium]|nr:hypothetical protein [Fibrobacteria bacterium]HOX50708.1 hypothetical protein [Fibrobacteria bacterium]
MANDQFANGYSTDQGRDAGQPGREIHPGLFSAIGLWIRTISYTIPAFFQLSLLSLVSVVAMGLICGLCVLAYFYVHKYATAVVATIGFVPLFIWWMPYTFRKQFSIGAGQVAVFTELLLTGKVERGTNSLYAHGRTQVAKMFGEEEVFHSFHSNLDSMLYHLVHTLDRVDDHVPGMEFVTKWISAIRGLIVRHTSFVVMSYALARGAASQSQLDQRSLEGTCYVAHNGVALLKTAVFAAILERIVSSVIWFLFGLVIACGVFYVGYALVFQLPMPDFAHFDMNLLTKMGLWYSIIAAAVLGPVLGFMAALSFMETVMHPISTAMVLLKFHKVIESQPLPLQWANRIEDGTYATDRLDWLSFQALGISH